MKKLISILCVILVASTSMAQSSQQLMQKGNDAYGKGDYEAAVEAYNAVLTSGQQSAELYYNLGNAYYRQDEMGQAILNYERALRLKPHFTDARQNLELAYSKTEDKIDELPQVFLAQWAHAVVTWFSPNGWLVVLLILAALLALLVVFFFVGSDYAWRKRSLLVGLLLCLALLLATACTIASHVQYNKRDKAIITNPMIVMKGSPEAGGIDKMVLHEGTKVTVDETLGFWHKVHIADGTSGWVESSDVTII